MKKLKKFIIRLKYNKFVSFFIKQVIDYKI